MSGGGGGGERTPLFSKLGPNEKCVKGMQVRKQGVGVKKYITYPIQG